MDHSDRVSRDYFISNVLYGSKMMSAFKMARGYTPAIIGLEKKPISKEILKAHEEKVARRALHKLQRHRSPQTVPRENVQKDTALY